MQTSQVHHHIQPPAAGERAPHHFHHHFDDGDELRHAVDVAGAPAPCRRDLHGQLIGGAGGHAPSHYHRHHDDGDRCNLAWDPPTPEKRPPRHVVDANAWRGPDVSAAPAGVAEFRGDDLDAAAVRRERIASARKPDDAVRASVVPRGTRRFFRRGVAATRRPLSRDLRRGRRDSTRLLPRPAPRRRCLTRPLPRPPPRRRRDSKTSPATAAAAPPRLDGTSPATAAAASPRRSPTVRDPPPARRSLAAKLRGARALAGSTETTAAVRLQHAFKRHARQGVSAGGGALLLLGARGNVGAGAGAVAMATDVSHVLRELGVVLDKRELATLVGDARKAALATSADGSVPVAAVVDAVVRAVGA